VPFVFHRDGERIKYFRAAWDNACKEAGCPNALVHDMRRSAVRTFERAGVPRSAAMSMVGHKTESIYRRYAIVDEQMQREAAARLDAFTAAMPHAGRKTGTVAAFPKASGRGDRLKTGRFSLSSGAIETHNGVKRNLSSERRSAAFGLTTPNQPRAVSDRGASAASGCYPAVQGYKPSHK